MIISGNMPLPSASVPQDGAIGVAQGAATPEGLFELLSAILAFKAGQDAPKDPLSAQPDNSSTPREKNEPSREKERVSWPAEIAFPGLPQEIFARISHVLNEKTSDGQPLSKEDLLRRVSEVLGVQSAAPAPGTLPLTLSRDLSAPVAETAQQATSDVSFMPEGFEENNRIEDEALQILSSASENPPFMKLKKEQKKDNEIIPDPLTEEQMVPTSEAPTSPLPSDKASQDSSDSSPPPKTTDSGSVSQTAENPFATGQSDFSAFAGALAKEKKRSSDHLFTTTYNETDSDIAVSSKASQNAPSSFLPDIKPTEQPFNTAGEKKTPEPETQKFLNPSPEKSDAVSTISRNEFDFKGEKHALEIGAAGQSPSGQMITHALYGQNGNHSPSPAVHATPIVYQSAQTETVAIHMVANAKAGVETITLQLTPENLGQVEVKLTFSDDGDMTARISADKPETLTMMQNDSSALQKSLQQAGFKTDASTLSFDLRQNGQDTAGQTHDHHRGHQGYKTYQDGFPANDTGLQALLAAQTLNYIGKTGVNIVV